MLVCRRQQKIIKTHTFSAISCKRSACVDDAAKGCLRILDSLIPAIERYSVSHWRVRLSPSRPGAYKEDLHQDPVHVTDAERPTRQESECGVEPDVKDGDKTEKFDEVFCLARVSTEVGSAVCGCFAHHLFETW